MTRNEFLEAFSKVAKKYKCKLDNEGSIRSTKIHIDLCPIEIVHHAKNKTLKSWFNASILLGLTPNLTDNIISAADNRHNRSKLRKQLLEIII